MVAYYSDRIEEIIVAEQGELTEGEEALLEVLQKKLRRELASRVENDQPGGTPLNKKNLVLKLLKNPTVRRTLINLLKNRHVRSMIFKQVTRRLGRR